MAFCVASTLRVNLLQLCAIFLFSVRSHFDRCSQNSILQQMIVFASNGNVKEMIACLEQGANINARDDVRAQLLFNENISTKQCQEKHFDLQSSICPCSPATESLLILRSRLLSCINHPQDEHATALIWACNKARLECVEILLSRQPPPDIDARDEVRRYPQVYTSLIELFVCNHL